ncbi:hypothetical protein RS030_132057 [Cryptosporidium xiaoi]|uniref:Uncharacterized protein n=1 Tax=Cryptosporidium xiaoi TaxID=659607 RepID=A0AAV9Y1F9_9CRYT
MTYKLESNENLQKNIFKHNSNNKNRIYISGLNLPIETIVIDIKSYYIFKISDNVPYNIQIANINE